MSTRLKFRGIIIQALDLDTVVKLGLEGTSFFGYGLKQDC